MIPAFIVAAIIVTFVVMAICGAEIVLESLARSSLRNRRDARVVHCEALFKHCIEQMDNANVGSSATATQAAFNAYVLRGDASEYDFDMTYEEIDSRSIYYLSTRRYRFSINPSNYRMEIQVFRTNQEYETLPGSYGGLTYLHGLIYMAHWKRYKKRVLKAQRKNRKEFAKKLRIVTYEIRSQRPTPPLQWP